MPTKNIEITNATGLHARPAQRFAETAGRFRSKVSVRKGGKTVNGKSLWDMLLLVAPPGTTLHVEVEGDDAEECLTRLTELLRDPDNEQADS